MCQQHQLKNNSNNNTEAFGNEIDCFSLSTAMCVSVGNHSKFETKTMSIEHMNTLKPQRIN